MQNFLTEITLKPFLHQIKNAYLLLSIDKMTKYTYIVILNVTLMIYNKDRSSSVLWALPVLAGEIIMQVIVIRQDMRNAITEEWRKCYSGLKEERAHVTENIWKGFLEVVVFEMGFGEWVWFNKQGCTEGQFKQKE